MSANPISPAVGTNFLRALYAGNMLWHTSAFFHFSFRAPYMMQKLSKRSASKDPSISSTPQGDEWHHDVMAYLGFINVGYAALAGLRLYDSLSSTSPASLSSVVFEVDVLALTVLGIANGSQAWGNFVRTRGSGRWIMGIGSWDRITILDASFMVADLAVVGAYLLGL